MTKTTTAAHNKLAVSMYCALSVANAVWWFLTPKVPSFWPTLVALWHPMFAAVTSFLLFAWGYLLVSRRRSGRLRRKLIWVALLLSALPLVHIMVLMGELAPPP